MLVVEGPGIDSLSAPGFELIQADEASSNRREAIMAGSLSTGPVLQVWVPDRRQLADYRVTLMQVSGDNCQWPLKMSHFWPLKMSHFAG